MTTRKYFAMVTGQTVSIAETNEHGGYTFIAHHAINSNLWHWLRDQAKVITIVNIDTESETISTLPMLNAIKGDN